MVIKVENLGKQYKLGLTRHDLLSEKVMAGAKGVVRTAKRLFRRTPNPSAVPGIGPSSVVDSRNGYIWALKDVSFQVKQGEVIGVIGRNGAGKSTLLKILTGITEPTEGRAWIKGRVGSLLEVGTGFHQELTGRENIFLNGAILGMGRAEIKRKFDEIVEFAEVEKFIDTPVKRYSSGMYVRLAFAVAAHLEPEILLVDEVLAVGDATFQKKCLRKMEDVTSEGRTILFVSHNMASIKQLCSRCVLLQNGSVKFTGSTNDAFNLYLGGGRTRTISEYQWNERNAPGDEIACMKSIRVCTASGETRSEFGTDEPIYVEACYLIHRRVPKFRIGLSLYSEDGTHVFYTSDDDKGLHAGMPREGGEYMSRCEIPGEWLNTGSYQVRISGGIFGIRTVFKDIPPLVISIVSTGGVTNYVENRSGILRPRMSWDVRSECF